MVKNYVSVYEIIINPAYHFSPILRKRRDDSPTSRDEWNKGDQFIDKIFDFTESFDDLGYWNSKEMFNEHPCDEALIQLRNTLLQMQSEQIRPRKMTSEEIAYYRFPSWWFGKTPGTTPEPLENKERLSILMRHLLDMYNEIRLRPEFRAETDYPLFYCKYT